MVLTQQRVQLDPGGQDFGVGGAVGVPEGLKSPAAGGDLLFQDMNGFWIGLQHVSF